MYILGIFTTHPLPAIFHRYAGSAFSQAGRNLAICNGVEPAKAMAHNQQYQVAKSGHWVLWFESSGPDDLELPNAADLVSAADPSISGSAAEAPAVAAADTSEIQGKETGAFAFFDNGRWRVSFQSIYEWLPEGLSRQQAEAVLNLLPKAYYAGRRKAGEEYERELAYARSMGGH